MFKPFILFAIAISAILFTHHAKSNCPKDGFFVGGTSPINCISKEYIRQKIEKKRLEIEQEEEWSKLEKFSVTSCPSKEFPVYRGFSIIACVLREELEQDRLNRNEINIIGLSLQWFIVGFIITTIMSIPINILWRFRFKVPAYLLTIMTALAIMAIPFIFSW
ncbi:hypothetical protein [Bartonella sp. MM73XJBT.G]|uniref:hypothetical protein n=1 Tax=Bartonella sp. MM73XJBT.G TaxID=3019097 RepID=UPI00235FB094|nr:hypothetical protein [Bartonella sp. MM73XJBT.G]